MKEKIIVISFIVITFIVPLTIIIKEDETISKYERRTLKTKEYLKNNPIDNLETYMTDQFPLRNVFISINNIYNRYILNNNSHNDVYIYNDSLIEKNYPLNKKSLLEFINKINYINDTYLSNSKTYISIIPDKAYFLNEDYLKINYNEVYDELKKINIENIKIEDKLTLEDYYKTDIHLKQKSYLKLMKTFDEHMDFKYKEIEYKEEILNDFKGSSYSKVPNIFKSENLEYLTNDILNNTIVKHLEYDTKTVYNIEQYKSVDPYNIFLNGPSSYVELNNKNSITDKELIIFRDSFASSFAPLLIPYYKKITLIDLRYTKMDVIKSTVDFNNKDVLFLYSMQIVNNSNILKI